MSTSKPSFQSFSYTLRPAKNVERKMLSEACRRLAYFEPVENYRYIGFGSTTFTDFILFHKQLGIQEMYSIEHNQKFKARFEFNRPYKCIELAFGKSNDVLLDFDWNIRTIVWLDYESGLIESVLNDIAHICMKAISGTTLVVTLNARPNTFSLPPNLRRASSEEQEKHRLDQFKKVVGEKKVPAEIKGKDLAGEALPKTYRQVVMAEIEKILGDRNGLLPKNQKMEYLPLFNFLYSDGAQMMTIGGILYESQDKPIIERCDFEALDFIRTGEEAYSIDMPILTQRERHHLDSMLPTDLAEFPDIGLTNEEIANYQKLYRYFPSFVEVEVA